MLKEFVEALADQAVRAASTRFVDLSKYGEPGGCYAAVLPDGTWEFQEAEDPPRKCVAFSLDTVAAHARLDESVPGEIWYGRNGVWWVEAAGDRVDIGRAHVRMPLTFTPQFQMVQFWNRDPSEFGTELKQQKLIHLLRTTFSGCVETPELQAGLRLLRWSRGETTESAVQIGKSSIGRQTRGEVTGEAGLPATFTLNVPVFTEFDATQPVEVAVEPIAERETIALRPVGNAVESAVAGAEDVIRMVIQDLLQGAAVKLYHGDPKLS